MTKLKLMMAALITSAVSTSVFALDAQFADTKWDGVTVPDGQQCQKFGGIKPMTPTLSVNNLPEGTDAIVLEYSDRSFKKMDNGGHGKMQFTLQSTATQVEVPSVVGHSFELPDNFKMLNAHLSPGWDKAGAYMPPCSGGKGNSYYVTIKAVMGDKVLDTTVLELGKF